MDESSLIRALFDGSRELSTEDEEILDLIAGKDALVLLNKTDLAPVLTAEKLAERTQAPVIAIATVTEHGLDDLAAAIQKKVYDSGMDSGDEGSFVNDERQAEILRQADEHLAAALRTIGAGLGLDFISIDLRSAWEKLGELTGETVGEDIINEIFSKFCIGK